MSFFSALFQDSGFGTTVEYVINWILVIFTYSVITFLVTLVFSLYTPLSEQHEAGQESKNRF